MLVSDVINQLNDAAFPARTVAYTGTAGSTSTWPAGPQAVAVWSDQACYVAVGEGITATTSNGIPIPANRLTLISVPKGTGAPWRVSAIQVSTGGTVYCKPVNLN